MKKLIQKITALVCSAAVLLSLGMSVTAAEGQKPVYEVDDSEYRAAVDALYSYIPLESIVLTSLYDMVNGYTGYYETKWFYKHVFTNAPEAEVDIHPSDVSIADEIPYTAESSFIAEQGRGDTIEEEDGKVRKFNEITVYWNILLSKKVLRQENINAFLEDKGYAAAAVQADSNGKRFCLKIDRSITKEQLFDTVEALNMQFGLLPKVFGYEKRQYTLYHDPDYTGYNNEKDYDTKNYSNDYLHIYISKRDHCKKLKNIGSFESGVRFEFNTENRVLIIDGAGSISYEEQTALCETFIYYRQAAAVVIGKDVTFETNAEYKRRTDPENAQNASDGSKLIQEMSRGQCEQYLYVYRDSPADKSYAAVLSAQNNPHEGIDYKLQYCINYVDDDTDINDVLSGKTVLVPQDDKTGYAEFMRQIYEYTDKRLRQLEEEKNNIRKKVTLKGDADLNGIFDLADVTTVAKYNLSYSSYPLKSDTAQANADYNEDGAVDGIDLSIIIEIQLGREGFD